MKLPSARNQNIVVQHLGKEVLVYDLVSNQAFCLNETSSIIYQSCDGKTSFGELKNKHNFSIDLIFLALDQLKEQNLIENFESPFAGVSRREVIRKVGLATMTALPVIAGLTVPTAAHAQSGGCALGTNVGDPSGFQGMGGTCQCTTATSAGSSCGQGNTSNPSNSCRTGCICTTNNPAIIVGGNLLGSCG